MGRSRFGFVIVAFASCGCAGTAADVSAPPAMEAMTIIQSMADRYRSAVTYADEGTYHSVSRKPDGEVDYTTTAHFRTRWAAPDRLRFEFQEDPNEYFAHEPIVVWTPRAGVTKSLFLGKVEEVKSLRDALYAVQGVSLGTTGMAPRWLAEHGGKLFVQYELRGRTPCGTATCYELSGWVRPMEQVTLFIDSGNYALRKAVWHSTRPREPIPKDLLKDLAPELREGLRETPEDREPVDDVSTLELEPTFDRPLEADAFDFKPPTEQ